MDDDVDCEDHNGGENGNNGDANYMMRIVFAGVNNSTLTGEALDLKSANITYPGKQDHLR